MVPECSYCKLEIFVPQSHLEAVQRALAQVDAGHIGRYDNCLSYSTVTSCWRPLEGASPYLGTLGELCWEQEIKVEVTCRTAQLEETLEAVRRVHPYEEPVINVIPLWGTGIPAPRAGTHHDAGITEVVAALIWQGERFLICQRPAHKARGGLWEFVGGKVEAGETKQQALVRECREELAVTVEVGEVFWEGTHTYPDLTIHLTLFHGVLTAGTPQRLEHSDLRWITVDEIPQYAFCPADTAILEQLQQTCGGGRKAQNIQNMHE